MTKNRIYYEVLVQDALRNVIRKVLKDVEEAGLPGEHYFFVTFLTDAPGVLISPDLRKRYPNQITVVLQHQFWNLHVEELCFKVTLSFGKTLEKLIVPFSAIRGFYDPIAAFEAVFDIPNNHEHVDDMIILDNPESQLIRRSGENIQIQNRIVETSKPPADIISLDAFRNNN